MTWRIRLDDWTLMDGDKQVASLKWCKVRGCYLDDQGKRYQKFEEGKRGVEERFSPKVKVKR